jgi:hypothetical protein
MGQLEQEAQTVAVLSTVYDLVTLLIATQSYCALVLSVATELAPEQRAFLVRAQGAIGRTCAALDLDPAALRAEFGGGA